jgi:hypothetical protein
MIELYGLPQPITGAELVTIYQMQGGNLVSCTMPLYELAAVLNTNSTSWANTLPTTRPATAGVLWNNGGAVSIS